MDIQHWTSTLDKNWMLGLIMEAIRALDDKRGSRVTEMFAVFHANTSSSQSVSIAKKCAMFKKALLYGVRLGMVRPACGNRRFKMGRSGPAVARFLLSLQKSLPPHNEDTAKHNDEQRLEVELQLPIRAESLHDLKLMRGMARARARRNRSVTDFKITRCKEQSEYSDSECEII